MKYLLLIVFLIGCAPKPKTPPKVGAVDMRQLLLANQDGRKAAKCLREFITGEDAGGEWVILAHPVGFTPPALVGDNPCIEFTSCGDYTLKYRVTNVCCKDSVTFGVKKCCVTGTSTCL